jgi:hypothetical protein
MFKGLGGILGKRAHCPHQEASAHKHSIPGFGRLLMLCKSCRTIQVGGVGEMVEANRARRKRVPKKRIVLGEINIVSHPHTPQDYIDTFSALYEKRVRALYHGQRYIEIGRIKKCDDERLPEAITGQFFVFSKVNFDDPWLNINKNDAATDEELEEINIPSHLVPEFRFFRFIFEPKRHRLYFEKSTVGRHNLSPKALALALNKMFADPAVSKKFDEISAFVVSDVSSVERMLKLNKLRKLFIRVHRPNADDEDFEHALFAQMNGENVGTREMTLIKAPGFHTILPSSFTQKLAKLAAKMGLVEAWGKDEQGAPIREDSASHPVEHNVVFPEGEDALGNMVAKVSQLNGDAVLKK